MLHTKEQGIEMAPRCRENRQNVMRFFKFMRYINCKSIMKLRAVHCVLIIYMTGIVLLFGTAVSVSAQTCSTSECHTEIKNAVIIHSPVEEDECLSCHEQRNAEHPSEKGGFDFVLTASGSQLCNQCHDPIEKGKSVHAPVAEGECLACHLAHGSSVPSLLKGSENQKTLCFECHDSAPFELQYVHGPVDSGACTYCHSPHRSGRKSLLREALQDVCLGCHVDFSEGFLEAKFVHSAVKKKSCVSCHNAHSSSVPRLLIKEGQELCFECHKEVERKYKMSSSKHEPLYNENRCGNCHLVHFSEKEKLLVKEEMPLCLKCHGHDYSNKPESLRNIKQELKDRKYQHGPVAEEQCSPCHDPHGSSFSKLTKGPYPAGFYASYRSGIYDFCFECHDDVMLRDRENSKATDFRNGSQNLHYLHVAREFKGRTCHSCHATHASSGAKLITDEGVPFGDWEIPVRFVMTETGGSCTPGCHRRMDYDRTQKTKNEPPQIDPNPPYVDYR